MKDAYTKLMVQQHTSADADAAFFEKLENTARKKQKPAWKAAVAIACALLLVPITALAAKYILHQPQVAPVEKEFIQEKVAHYGTFKGMETIKEKGYEIEYPDLAFFSIEDIPEEYQNPEATTIAYNSWNLFQTNRFCILNTFKMKIFPVKIIQISIKSSINSTMCNN